MSKAGANEQADKEFVEGIRQGDLAAVLRALTAGADIECVDQYGFPGLPLRTACFLGHKEIVVELLKRGADIYATNSDGPGAPLRMATRGKRDEIVAILRQHAADVPSTVSHVQKIPPVVPDMLATRKSARSDEYRPNSAAPSAGSGRITEVKQAGPAVHPRKVPELNKTVRAELGVESVVINSCYGVDTNVLEGDLLRLSQSDAIKSKGK